jgi:hypothetical protein
MSKPFYPTYQYTIAPGAKERIERRLKDLPEINKNRPCKNCLYYDGNYAIRCRAHNLCNFNHDQFVPVDKN